ncbi:MAG TPA: TlyA family RNA methyltransferase [Candidatus Paceibacterota bacterium]|nr:TlyA family RNA methyltransferase [Candidatus Paceibacterota bacterium]
MESKTPLQHKNRLDVEMHARRIVRSRSAAADLIKRGKVSVNGAVATKPSLEVSPSDAIDMAGGATFVSRAGEKLAHALSSFKIDVADMTALDVGSSTGGFTDCLLKNGAKKVVAIDVGTDQMDASLRSDPRVEIREGVDIRDASLDSPADMATVDLSFISVEHALPKVYTLIKKGGHVVVLVKPQFEVGKEITDKHKGIITDESERKQALDRVIASAKKIGFSVKGQTDSPIEGEKGNREFLLYLTK